MRDQQRPRGPGQRPLGGYAPLVVLIGALVAMVALVPSTVPADQVASSAPGAPTAVDEGVPASGWGDSVAACADRDEQIEGGEYTPPCFTYDPVLGNGGATARGVTADEIIVSYRVPADQDIMQWFAQLGGVHTDASNEQMLADARAMVDYANANFEMYGRKIRLVNYGGRGQILPELQQAGQDNATNDSIHAASEIGAFADITAITQPYADALTRNGVVAIGAPYMSRQWFEERRPYAWSHVPDCTVTAESGAAYGNNRLFGRDATFAGGEAAGRPRALAVVAPTNREYQQCVDTYVDLLAAQGNDVALRLDYTLDAAVLQSEATNLAARLRDAGVTSVSCACDPIMQMYLAQQMARHGLQPEWIIAGVGFIDLDLVGQILHRNAPDQWTQAFGFSPTTAPLPPETSAAHAAYRSVRPDGEPSDELKRLYDRVMMLAIGIQMAGPELTPENFEAGMMAWPGGDGQSGRWKFGPGHYTPFADMRELWWDPTKVSPFNGQLGTYVDVGERYTPDDLPAGEPEAFP
jgi:hypothetical protein